MSSYVTTATTVAAAVTTMAAISRGFTFLELIGAVTVATGVCIIRSRKSACGQRV